MIDYIKTEIINPDIVSIKNNRNLTFRGYYTEDTGEINDRKLKAYFEGLTFTIVEHRRVFVEGSLSTFYLGNNYQNLFYTDLQKAFKKLYDLFRIVPENFKLQNIEIGVNINTEEINPSQFLEAEVIDYKVTTKEIKTHNGKGYTISFPLKNYVVKLYDKGRQFNLENNLLRFEIRVKKMIHIKKLGIETLYDLHNIDKWEMLKILLIKTFNDIIICYLHNHENFSNEDALFYRKASNQQFWLRNWPNSKDYVLGSKDIRYTNFRNEYYKKRADFKNLIIKYGLDKNKKHILSKISKELDKIIES